MPLNLTKRYSSLLEILHFSEPDRIKSLRGVFNQDIANNENFKFRGKTIRPLKVEGEIDIDRLFTHLTTMDEYVKDEVTGEELKKRTFECDRSMRLHWIKHHISESCPHKIEVFSTEERDIRRRTNMFRTYIYDKDERYIIVLEPQRSRTDYTLLTAYYLNKPGGKKKIEKLKKKKLIEIL